MSVDPLTSKYPNSSPYVFTADNPIIYVDNDGRDYTYSAKNVQNKDGSVTKVVTISVVYKVVNLSNKELNGGEFNQPEAKLSTQLDYKSPDAKYLKGVKDVVVNVDVTFEVVKDISNIKSGENALFIVNSINNKESKEVAGLASVGGNVALVEANYIDYNKLGLFSELVEHEVGHNLSLNHDDNSKNVMNSSLTNSTDFTETQKKEFDNANTPAFKEGVGKIVNGDVKTNAKSFLQKNASSYNKEKAKKANVE